MRKTKALLSYPANWDTETEELYKKYQRWYDINYDVYNPFCLKDAFAGLNFNDSEFESQLQDAYRKVAKSASIFIRVPDNEGVILEGVGDMEIIDGRFALQAQRLSRKINMLKLCTRAKLIG